ncbi:MAG: class I SAM-dependent methyltransferase [Deltaproteobacteria bacterium]|nr:class I SAM-dependent methyltransferase [Deltaproteobacteria bacterium]
MKAFLSGYYRRPISISETYVIAECVACGTLFQRDVPCEDLLNELYDVWIAPRQPEDDRGYAFDVQHPALSRDGHELMSAAAHLGIPLDQMVVLDWGMGWAGWARVAASLGCRAHGYDIAQSRQDLAATYGVAPDNASYDFINTEQFLEHSTDPRGIVEQLAGKLKPGGILKISVPGQAKVREVLADISCGRASLSDRRLMPLHPLEHLNCFSREALTRIGAPFGLRPVRPGWLARYAFIGHRGALDLADPRRTAKELIRPWYQWHSRTNSYIWLRKL